MYMYVYRDSRSSPKLSSDGIVGNKKILAMDVFILVLLQLLR